MRVHTRLSIYGVPMSPDISRRERVLRAVDRALCFVYLIMVVWNLYFIATGWPVLDRRPWSWVFSLGSLTIMAWASVQFDTMVTAIYRRNGWVRVRPRPVLPCVVDRTELREVTLLRPGRHAVRLNPTRVKVVCDACGYGLVIGHHDGGLPMSEVDLLDALVGWDHECPTEKG
jgi:hypothetical protein